jgi:competence protein CoiA-like protein
MQCAVAHLAWVVVDERLRPVGDFAHLAPNARPEARCPLCRDLVTLKLGDERIHHAAHRAGTGCALGSQGESAAHLNVKCHLAAALRAAAGERVRLMVRDRCRESVRLPDSQRSTRCSIVQDTLWLAGWDAVEMELTIGSRRPDLTLFRAGQAMGVIEVVAHHGIDEAKRTYLAAMELPWIEVRADARLYDVLRPWTVEHPLPTMHRSALGDVPWRCPEHAQRVARRQARVENGCRPWLVRAADCYDARGQRVRDVLYLEAELRGGRVVAIRLMHTADDDVIAKVRPESRRHAVRVLHEAFVGWTRLQRREHRFVDSPMPWIPARWLRGTSRTMAILESSCPVRFRYDRQRGRWERIEGTAAGGWDVEQFRPEGHRDVRGRRP